MNSNNIRDLRQNPALLPSRHLVVMGWVKSRLAVEEQGQLSAKIYTNFVFFREREREMFRGDRRIALHAMAVFYRLDD